MRRTGVTLVAVVAMCAAIAIAFTGSASAANFGVSILKDCHTPINVGDAYACEFEISNTVQASGLTVTTKSLTDTVFAAGGNQSFSEPLNNTVPGLIFTGGAFCGPTNCTIPFGGSITTPFISHYAATAADFPSLGDQGGFVWNEVCNGFPGCSAADNPGTTSASADINPIPTTATTSISSNGVNGVTAVETGSSVSDNVTVTSDIQNQPAPTGNVTLSFFTNLTCSGSPADAPSTETLDSNGQALNRHPEGPLAAGLYSYLAHYEGSANGEYLASHDDQCEPLRVVDANIQISPANATNPLNTNHTLTGHVNVNDGSGFTNAPAGTLISFQILSGPGTFVGPSSCTTIGTTGSCTVQITSGTAGTTVIRDSTNVSVAGVSLSRASGDGKAGDSPDANKLWVSPDANIQISPANATNPIGSNHTLTGHVNVATDGSTFSNAPAGTLISFSIVSGPGSFVGGVNTCTTIAATGSCTVQITSSTAGTTVVRASTDVTVSGVVLHRETNDGHAGDSVDANKLWFVPDANIQISPQQASDPVGDTHTLTGHVNVAPDGSTFSNAPAGTLITFSIVSGPGSFVGGVNTCLTIGTTGSCTVQITSAVAGTTVIRAATDVTVNGVQLHRETNDNHTGDSSDANKTWVPPGGIIAPTQTTCNDVLNGTAATLGQINYSVTGGKIGQGINPGVFFFYTKITTTIPNQVVTVTQTNTSTNNAALFGILNGQAWLWKGDCSSHTVGALLNNGSGASFTVPTPGNYIIGIKYQTKSIAGTTAPVPANITYNFTTSLGGSTGASVLLKKQ